MRVKDALIGLTPKKIEWNAKLVDLAPMQRWIVEYDGIPYYCIFYKYGRQPGKFEKSRLMELHDLEAHSISVAKLENIKVYKGKCFNEETGRIEDLK